MGLGKPSAEMQFEFRWLTYLTHNYFFTVAVAIQTNLKE